MLPIENISETKGTSATAVNERVFYEWCMSITLREDSKKVYSYMWSTLCQALGEQSVMDASVDTLASAVSAAGVNKSPEYKRRMSQLLSRVILMQHPESQARTLPFRFPAAERKPKPDVLTDWQTNALDRLESLAKDDERNRQYQRRPADWKETRDLAIVAVTLGSGIKLHELIALRTQDAIVHMYGVELNIRGPRSRKAPLSNRAFPFLRDWMDFLEKAFEGRDNNLPLFIGTLSAKGEAKMSKPTAYRGFRLILERAGISQGASGKLRNTFGQRNLDEGVKPNIVANWMGLHNADSVTRFKQPGNK